MPDTRRSGPKIIIGAIGLTFFLCMVCAAGFAETNTRPLRIAALKGPSAMGLVKMMEDKRDTKDYAFTLAGSPDAIVPGLVRGEFDVAFVPANLAAVLYANTEGAVRVIAVNTLGSLYVVERGNTVHSLSDLSGRTLYAAGKASTPEYALRLALEQADMPDLDIQWKSEHSEALAALARDPRGLSLLPQPFLAAAGGIISDLRIALDISQVWEALTGEKLVTGVTVARRDLLFTPEGAAQVSLFMDACAASVSYVNSHVTEAAKLIESAGILAAGPAQAALPDCGIVFIEGTRMKTLLTAFYEALFEKNPAAVGGAVPDDEAYFLR